MLSVKLQHGAWGVVQLPVYQCLGGHSGTHQVECCVPLGQAVLKRLFVGAETHGLKHDNVVIQLLAHDLLKLQQQTRSH